MLTNPEAFQDLLDLANKIELGQNPEVKDCLDVLRHVPQTHEAKYLADIIGEYVLEKMGA